MLLAYAPSKQLVIESPVAQETVEPPESQEASRLVFVGDIMLSRSVGDLMASKNDSHYPFRLLGDYISSADLAFANLENPVSTRGIKVGSIYSFRADPKTLQGLSAAGFDIVSLANNHIWDYGRQAFLDTLSHLKENTIAYVGAGLNFKEAHAGFSRQLGDNAVTFLAYTNLLPASVAATQDSSGVAYFNQAQMIDDIKATKQNGGIVIVTLHWGEEYQRQHNLTQEGIARSAIDNGASLVIGHHPHVRQGVEKYGDGYIAYSLGNFIFDQTFSQETMTGLALEVYLRNNMIEKVLSRDVYISRQYQPSISNEFIEY